MTALKLFRTFLLFSLVAALFMGCESKRSIVTDLHEREANNIIVFLSSHGINAEKEKKAVTGAAGGGSAESLWSISVPSNQAVEALAILNRAGLPRRPTETLLGIFSKSGLVSSAQEEQIRYQEGLSKQIAGTIRQIDGVIDTNVQISFPQTETGEPSEEPIRASVYVKHSGILDDPNSQLIPKIKRLVSGSIAGLDLDKVTVVTDRARYTDLGMDEGEGAERSYTEVWSVLVASDSVGRFQTIFFVLCIIILVLAALIAWMVWKLFPLMQMAGGVKGMFTDLKPLSTREGKEPKAGAEEEEEGEESEEEGE